MNATDYVVMIISDNHQVQYFDQHVIMCNNGDVYDFVLFFSTILYEMDFFTEYHKR